MRRKEGAIPRKVPSPCQRIPNWKGHRWGAVWPEDWLKEERKVRGEGRRVSEELNWAYLVELIFVEGKIGGQLFYTHFVTALHLLSTTASTTLTLRILLPLSIFHRCHCTATPPLPQKQNHQYRIFTMGLTTGLIKPQFFSGLIKPRFFSGPFSLWTAYCLHLYHFFFLYNDNIYE